jgi:hypothetical protein
MEEGVDSRRGTGRKIDVLGVCWETIASYTSIRR